MKIPFQAILCFSTWTVLDTEKYFSATGERSGLSEMIKWIVTALQNSVAESGARRLLRLEKYKINQLRRAATLHPQEEKVAIVQENLVSQGLKRPSQVFRFDTIQKIKKSSTV